MDPFPFDPNGPGPSASAAGLELVLLVMIGVLVLVGITVLLLTVPSSRRSEATRGERGNAGPDAREPILFQIALLTPDTDEVLIDGLIQAPGMANRVPFTIAAVMDTAARLGLGRGQLVRWAEEGTMLEFRLWISASGGVEVELRSEKERIQLRALALAPAIHTGTH
jgi:hypothetical protein